jgi:tetratricopeptide (TPR) repeat protein
VGCLQENTVLAFVEARLAPESRAAVETHARCCASCHALVAAALHLGGLARTAATERLGRGSGQPLQREPLHPGASIGRYTILGVVGRGGMGEVYAAFDPQLDRRVALKVLHEEGTASDPHARERLLREAQAIAKLSHPNVIVVHDVGVLEGRLFFAMEFVEGQTLAVWLLERPRTWREIVGTFTQAASGLAAAHAAGLVHRDFKPQNVMVAVDGAVRVTDFGLARRIDHHETAFAATDVEPQSAEDPSLTCTGQVLGTPLYMAPEQRAAGRVDARSDQYSFCVALYWALFGAHPFADQSKYAAAVALARPQLRSVPPRWVRRTLRRGLSPDPAARWSSMNELAQALTRSPSPRRRGIVAVAAVAALCLATGVGTIRAFGRREARLCSVGPARLVGVWELPDMASGPTSRREAVHAAILSAGGEEAPRIWQRLARLLDQRASAWLAVYRESCEATNVRHDQSAELFDLRTECLNDELDRTRALTDLLTAADATAAAHATEAAASLEDPVRCRDVRRLRAEPPQPADPSVRARVEQLRARLRDADRLQQIHGYRRAGDLARQVVVEAEPLHDCRLDSEAAVLEGEAEAVLDPQKGLPKLESALGRAEGCGEDRMVARAATTLVYAYGFSHLELAERFAALARAAIARLGGDSRLESWLDNNLSVALALNGRFPEARALAERAVKIKETTLGPEHLDVGISLDNLAGEMMMMGELQKALNVIERALAIESQWVEGPADVLLTALTTRGEILRRLGRFGEAERDFRRVLEAPWGDLIAARALQGLGELLVRRAQAREALPLLERAMGLEEGDSVFGLADTQFSLAKARDAIHSGDRTALKLAREAAAAYATTPNFPRERREIADWLAVHHSSLRHE